MDDNKLKILEVKFMNASSPSVIARADIHFDGFTLKGFKVAVSQETQKKYVLPPSYNSASGWRLLFSTDSKQDWQMIQNRVLADFQEFQTSDKYFNVEDIPD